LFFLIKDFEVFIRNIYAFYPLLIKYVDLQRAHWLKNPDVYSEQLYYNIAEVFSLWLSSKMFKREETNFVSANDIDNMMLIMPKSAQGGATNAGGANTVGGASSSGQEAGYSQKSGQSDEGPRKPGDKKKKRGQKGETKKFTSLIVACLKRLLPIGINFFEGKEQEMIQMAKQKFIDIKSGNDIVGMGAAAAAKQKVGFEFIFINIYLFKKLEILKRGF
jgi:ryanodine receptor 2